MKDLPSVEILRETIDYDPTTGVMKWKTTRWHRVAGNVAGTLTPKGYRRLGLNGVFYAGHRIAWKMHYGVDPVWIDHVNGIRDDNRIENLRSIEKSENNLNRKRPAHNKSGHIGVCFHKACKKWQAIITVRHKHMYLGLFDRIEDAIIARKKAEIEYGFSPKHGR